MPPRKQLRTIALFTQKGGVGKTTAAYNIAATLSEHARVLLIDADPQANLTRNIVKYLITRTLEATRVKLKENQIEIIINRVQENILLIDSRVRNDGGTPAEVPSSAENILNEAYEGAPYEAKSLKKLIDLIVTLNSSTNLYKCLEWLNRDVNLDYLQEAARNASNHLISLPLYQGQDENGQNVSNENLFLLPSHQLLFLEYNRPISLAIEGLGDDKSAFHSLMSRIFKINELIRLIGEARDIDIIIIDLNPATIELNSALTMTSDYCLMTLSPEPNSDHAMLSMLPVFKKWLATFKPLYAITSEAGFRRIESPPKNLGIFFQKVNKKLEVLQSDIEGYIIKRIERFYDNELHQFLAANQMTCGVTASTLPRIPYFVAANRKALFAGQPSVITDSTYQYNYRKLIEKIFENEIENIRDRVAKAVKVFKEAREKKIGKLHEIWSNKYIENLTQKENAERINSIMEFQHHYDY
jgi:cellulose biosynthesis protein BcsQ